MMDWLMMNWMMPSDDRLNDDGWRLWRLNDDGFYDDSWRWWIERWQAMIDWMMMIAEDDGLNDDGFLNDSWLYDDDDNKR